MSTLIYLDSWLVILAKAAGEPVQTRDTRQTTVVSAFRSRLSDNRLQPVHRIDQPVSGTVILARDERTFAIVQSAFESGEVHRRYLVVVDTPPEPSEGILEDRVLADREKTLIVTEDAGAGRDKSGRTRSARLWYQTIGNTDHHTILQVELETGRHHQIRAQLSHRGWHVVGDARYGARRPMRDRSIALHAWYISLPHPEFGRRLTITADLPETPLWTGVRRALTLPGPESPGPESPDSEDADRLR